MTTFPPHFQFFAEQVIPAHEEQFASGPDNDLSVILTTAGGQPKEVVAIVADESEVRDYDTGIVVQYERMIGVAESRLAGIEPGLCLGVEVNGQDYNVAAVHNNANSYWFRVTRDVVSEVSREGYRGEG